MANLFRRGFGAEMVEEGARTVLCYDRHLRAPFLSYEVEADGDHFVVLQFLGERMAATTEPTVVLNWLDQTRKVVAGQSNISN